LSSPALQLIVGLGNPGAQYQRTRHNAGFWLLDRLVTVGNWRTESKFAAETARLSLTGGDLWLLKPTTFMNRSGQAVSRFATFYRIPPEAILVVHDELDLPPGTVRIKQRGGHGGHNGLRDIATQLGSREFFRLRLGIGRPPAGEQDVVGYVLGRAPSEEQTRLEQAIDDAIAVLPDIVGGRLQHAIQILHSR